MMASKKRAFDHPAGLVSASPSVGPRWDIIMVEFHPAYTPEEPQFMQMLREVPGVTHVGWQTHDPSHGVILVTSQHAKDPRVRKRVMVCFKEPSPDLVPEAWRILAHVV